MFTETFPFRMGSIEFTGRLGSGGMARVYEGFRIGSAGVRTRIAIKCLLPERAWEEKAVQMFVEEARIIAQLHHPNIVALHDFGTVKGLPFILMEHVDGCDLAALLETLAEQNRRLPLPYAVDILKQVLNGLDYAHQVCDHEGQPLHLIHRDLKPANILLTQRGVAKISDFGIARTRQSLLNTSTGALKGTPLYCSPEQFKGAPLTPASDLFAVGLIAVHMLQGRSWFQDGNLAELAGAILQLDVERLLGQLDEETKVLQPVLRQCLAREPGERFPSAREALLVLDSVPVPRASPLELAGFLQSLLPTVRARVQARSSPLKALQTDLQTHTATSGSGLRLDATRDDELWLSGDALLRDEDGLSLRRAVTPSETSAPHPSQTETTLGTARPLRAESSQKAPAPTAAQKNRLPSWAATLLLFVLGSAVGAGGLAWIQQEQGPAMPARALDLGPAGVPVSAPRAETPVVKEPSGAANLPSVELSASGQSSAPETPPAKSAAPPAISAPQHLPTPATVASSLAEGAVLRPTPRPETNTSERTSKSATSSGAKAAPETPRGGSGTGHATAGVSNAVVSVVLSTLPNDRQLTIDGGEPQSVPWRGQLTEGRHAVTFHCEDYHHTEQLTIQRETPVRLVWNCPAKEPLRPVPQATTPLKAPGSATNGTLDPSAGPTINQAESHP